MTPPARPALLGLGGLAAGWALGSTPLTLAGLGLAALGGLALAWSAAARRLQAERTPGATALTEGDTLRYAVTARGAALVPGGLRLRDVVGPRSCETRLRRRRPVEIVVPAVPRGIHALGPGALVATDPLGLVEIEVPCPAGPAIRVRPRTVPLDATFADGGRHGAGGGRRARARLGGTEPHGVREHREGESLRAVHWASSARRGRLMVREMEEPPRDDVVVVLDLDRRGAAGPAGAGSIDEVIRCGASLALAEARRGRRVGLVLAGERPERLPVGASGTGWEGVLDALAAAQDVPGACTVALVGGRGRELGDGELVLVTARPVEAFAEALLRRGAAAVVAVDAPTYAGASGARPAPALLRLAAHGVPVAVVHAGDDLRRALSLGREAVGA